MQQGDAAWQAQAILSEFAFGLRHGHEALRAAVIAEATEGPEHQRMIDAIIVALDYHAEAMESQK